MRRTLLTSFLLCCGLGLAAQTNRLAPTEDELKLGTHTPAPPPEAREEAAVPATMTITLSDVVDLSRLFEQLYAQLAQRPDPENSVLVVTVRQRDLSLRPDEQ